MALCLLSLLFFASQDTVTKLLAADYAVAQFIMVRYWVFVAFALLFAIFRCGLRQALGSARPLLQFCRCLLGVLEVAVFALGLRFLGLAEMHAIFTIFPLITTVLAGMILSETIGWRRRLAVVVGFAGALIVIRPGMGVFSLAALIPVAAAFMFAGYNVITRMMSRSDRLETSLLYLAIVGAVVMTPFGIAEWRRPDAQAWQLMGWLSVSGVLGHLLLIKSLELAPAAVLQPLNYMLLVWATIFGFLVFGDFPDTLTILGAGLIVAGGLFTFAREQTKRAENPPATPPAQPVTVTAATAPLYEIAGEEDVRG